MEDVSTEDLRFRTFTPFHLDLKFCYTWEPGLWIGSIYLFVFGSDAWELKSATAV